MSTFCDLDGFACMKRFRQVNLDVMARNGSREHVDDTSRAIIEQLQADGRRAYASDRQGRRAVRGRRAAAGAEAGRSAASCRSSRSPTRCRSASPARRWSRSRPAVTSRRSPRSSPQIDEVDYLVITAGSFDILPRSSWRTTRTCCSWSTAHPRRSPASPAPNVPLSQARQADLQLGCPMTTTPVAPAPTAYDASSSRPPGARAPVDALHPHVVLRRGAGPDDRARRGRAHLRRPRQAPTSTASSGLFVVQAGHGRTRARRGRVQAGQRARVLPALVLRAPAGDRAGRPARRPRARAT